MYRHASGALPSRSVNPYSPASCPADSEAWFQRPTCGIGGECNHGTAGEPGRLRNAEVPRIGIGRSDGPLHHVSPVVLRHAVVLQHHLRAQPARGEGDGGAVVRGQLVALAPGHSEHCRLGEVVERRHPEVRGVVLGGAVSHLHHEAARTFDQQWKGMMARDEMGVDRQAQKVQTVVEVVLPQRRVPFEEVLTSPDVVDEDVETTGVPLDLLAPVRRPRRGRDGRRRRRWRCPRLRSRARPSPRSFLDGRTRIGARVSCDR